MSAADGEARLQLLLTEADEYIPALADGLDERALDRAPRPDLAAGPAPGGLEAHGVDPNDLPAQRWAVVAPEGERGDAMLAAIDALVQHRREQQGAAPQIYRVRSALDGSAAMRWRDEVHRAEHVPEDQRPRYLLLLGDLHEVSLELQQVLAGGAFVGRLHCPDLAGLRSYAEKVVAAELADAVDQARALFYTAEDGSSAVEFGRDKLIAPCLARTREWSQRGRLALADALEVPPADGESAELLDAAAAPHAVMLSLAHGLGAPRRGWTPEEQRARQGALFLGDDELGAADVRDRSFLPSGVWMSVACFSAGTPSTSAFAPWLATLDPDLGAAQVLRNLPRAGERPFLAALPQAALANPRGPLAFFGHIDLAWSFGFLDPMNDTSRASRVFSSLRILLDGGRAGVALDALMRIYRDTNDDLTARYQRQRQAAARGEADPEDPRQLGRLWMQRNDLRGYVLLGDPAARLSLKQRAHPRVPSSVDLPAGDPERAVLALLHGDEAPRAIAARFGISVAELFVWLDKVRVAGRCGLAE